MTETTTTTSLPRINDPAPQFEAISTHGPIRLSDYKGKWVVLFSHPADFTPVCTTEFNAFAQREPAFAEKGAQLIGLSVDGIYSHIAWVRNIEETFKNKITFPVIADVDRKVSMLFGMVHPNASETATVRCVFFIDPKQTIRAVIYYPMNVGRNMDEVLRVLDALQCADTNGVACPANWKKGDPVIVPAPKTKDAAEARFKEGHDTKQWYLSFKKA
jgi:peroxiredoxin (alkyl hydroperoxide reductase subunit C)